MPGALEQHQFAYRIRQSAAENNLKLVDLASKSGIEYQRLTRVLSGQAWMSMEDIGRIAEVMPQAFEGTVFDETRASPDESEYLADEWPPER